MQDDGYLGELSRVLSLYIHRQLSMCKECHGIEYSN